MGAIAYKRKIYGRNSAVWGDYYAPTIYSTEEREIGVWENNKPLYQKTIVLNNINIGYDSTVHSEIPHGISNLDECVLLQMSCPYLGIDAGSVLYNSDASVLANFRVNSTNIYATGGTNHFGAREERYWYFTIRYTKTTDVAGSGSYNTLGVPTVHYSQMSK